MPFIEFDVHHNFYTHRDVWRGLIEEKVLQFAELSEGRMYWEHELKAFDDSYHEDGRPKMKWFSVLHL